MKNETVMAPAAAPSSNGVGGADVLEEAIGKLVAERQRLRERGVDRGELESNRLQLVHLQWQLSYALIEWHQPPGSGSCP